MDLIRAPSVRGEWGSWGAAFAVEPALALRALMNAVRHAQPVRMAHPTFQVVLIPLLSLYFYYVILL